MFLAAKKSMRAFYKLCGFPADALYRFKLNGRRYRIGRTGMRTLKHLSAINDLCRNRQDRNWAMAARPLIRDIRRWNDSATLSLVVDRTEDPVLRILAIWLRGRCSGVMGTTWVAQFATHPDFHTRKEVARALKRMSNWPTLATIAAEDPDPRIRRLATSKAAKPVQKRITQFANNLTTQSSAQVAPAPLFVRSNLDVTKGKLPKSRRVIRQILERIRRLVGAHA